jgi:hypothetical protein
MITRKHIKLINDQFIFNDRINHSPTDHESYTPGEWYYPSTMTRTEAVGHFIRRELNSIDSQRQALSERYWRLIELRSAYEEVYNEV